MPWLRTFRSLRPCPDVVSGNKKGLVRITRYDLIVIGGGPAGEKGAAQAAYFGKKVALIDRGPALGGAVADRSPWSATRPKSAFGSRAAGRAFAAVRSRAARCRDNRIEESAIAGLPDSVQLMGDGNRVVRNQIIGATDRGVEVRTGGHEIALNLIVDGGADGIAPLDTGDGNHVHQNAVYGNADEGLEVATLDNRIEHNRVLLNGVDVQDSTADCDNNIWRDNEFKTSVSDDCID